jgi:hypothetical protein
MTKIAQPLDARIIWPPRACTRICAGIRAKCDRYCSYARRRLVATRGLCRLAAVVQALLSVEVR